MSSHSIQWDPNLKDVSEGRVILIPATLFTVLIILSTSFRIFAKLRLKKTLTVDDFLIIIALAFNLTGNVLEIQCVETGCGRHLQFLDTEERSRTRMLILDIILVANIALWAVKLSISFFLLGLVATVHRRARWIIYGLIIVTTLASLTQLIVWCLQARPLEKAWHPDIPGTVASPYVLITAHVVSQAIGAIADLFYAFSPIYFVGNLQMSPGKKALLISLTGSGLAVFAISIAHLAFVDDFLDPDYTWTLQHRVFIFGLIERNLAEVIANLPGLTPFFRSVYKKTSQIFASCIGGSTSCPDEEKRHGLSVVTIGSGGKPSKKGVTGRFQSLGKNAQFSELNSTLDNDQSRLWNDP